MAEKKVIQGEDIIVLVDSKTTLHATTHNLKVDLELKELRTKDTNGKEQSPGDISWSVDGDGLVVVDDSIEDSHTSEDVLGIVLSKKLVDVVIKSPLSGLSKTYHGKAYITSFSLGAPAGDNATYNYSLTGSGNLSPPKTQPSNSHERDHDQRESHADPFRDEGHRGVHQTSGIGLRREYYDDRRRREHRQHRCSYDRRAQRRRTTLRQRMPLYGGRRVGHLRRRTAPRAGNHATFRR